MAFLHVIQQALPGMAQYCDSPERNAGTFLRTSAVIFSRWFLVMRAASERERARQQAYREEHGFKKKAKVPALPLVLTDSETDVASLSEAAIRAMFGDEVADYAHDRFSCAMQTGDMRAFKIRLLMLKARDALQGPLQEEFKRWTASYIEEAEKAAGCTPCPGPRRMSHAERDRKLHKHEEEGSYYEDPWFKDKDAVPEADSGDDSASSSVHDPVHNSVDSDDNSSPTLPENPPSRKKRKRSLSSQALDVPISEGLPPVRDVVDSMSSILGGKTIEDMARNVADDGDMPQYNEDSPSDGAVTVTKNEKNEAVTVTNLCTVFTIPDGPSEHKAREYANVGEILDDIAAGKITPYASAADIVADMKRGILLPHEAMLFISAMDKTPENKRKPRGRAMKGRGRAEPLPPEEDEEDMDNEERYEETEGGDEEGGGGISYNPRGFGGCYRGDDW